MAELKQTGTEKKTAAKSKESVKSAKAVKSTKSEKSPKAAKTTKAKKAAKPAKKGKSRLVIVESFAKAKTIEKYLGTGYTVKASMGHLIDLPKSRIAIDIENNFKPEYITVRGRAKLLQELQRDAKKADEVLLASDPDREGEAIAWHLKETFSQKTLAPISRIVFNEITPDAIREAVKNPHEIDESMVNAQKARRVLDRLVGYNLSPLLWKKVKNGVSAGRVQSVALRLICEREKEVESFIPEEYWTLEAVFSKGKTQFDSQLVSYKNEKSELKNEKAVQSIIDEIKSSDCLVSDIKTSEKTIRPKAPFTTSKLQQSAANRLGFTARKTMQLAQQLYEGVAIGSNRVGLITYMRTDSVRISTTALDEAREWLGKEHPECLPEKPITYAVSTSAQDAHEGIRPTYVRYTPDYVKEYLSRDQLRLYAIIWERFVSSQMTNAKSRTLSVEFTAGNAVFRSSSTKIIEKGFYAVIKVLSDAGEGGSKSALPVLEIGEKVVAEDFRSEQHFTQGPARFTDASIVKMLEEKGIGRPSTYAPIVSVLLMRYYVTRSNKQLVPTQLGRIINDILVDYFPDVVNENFTAQVERDLDLVANNTAEWTEVVGSYFLPFKKTLDKVTDELESLKGTFDEKTDLVCEKCGKPMVKKLGRFGFFLACSGFPDCRTTKSIPLAKCPKKDCGGDIVARKTKARGKEFYGCTNYPSCDFLSHFKPINASCPQCGWFMVEKYDKKNGSYKACINPECDYLHSAEDEVAQVAAEAVE
ncbi:MAG: type I DNA topoisomerase [Treponemataceae bacterium]|nr:MAG: type I DNA topoisomerase [Treponemataceae bacterium]